MLHKGNLTKEVKCSCNFVYSLKLDFIELIQFVIILNQLFLAKSAFRLFALEFLHFIQIHIFCILVFFILIIFYLDNILYWIMVIWQFTFKRVSYSSL